jgi:hypothetical protein
MNSMRFSRREMIAASLVTLMCPGMLARAAQTNQPPAEPFVPSDGANKPMGVGKGINPGRVVWVHDPNATRWDGQTESLSVKSATGEWWDDANCDPKLVDAMVSKALQGLTGKTTDREAWNALFQHFNQTRGLGDNGYKPAEKISIKINANNDRSNTKPWPSGRGMPSPQVVHALLRQLVQVAGVPGKDITVFDATDGR